MKSEESELKEKSFQIVKKLAQIVAEDGEKITIENDMGFGTGTITINNEHSHFGDKNKEKGLSNFIDGLHGLLVEEKGLSWSSDPLIEKITKDWDKTLKRLSEE